MSTFPPPTHKRHRCPPEIIAPAIWLYFRCSLSYRDVEELRAERFATWRAASGTPAMV